MRQNYQLKFSIEPSDLYYNMVIWSEVHFLTETLRNPAGTILVSLSLSLSLSFREMCARFVENRDCYSHLFMDTL